MKIRRIDLTEDQNEKEIILVRRTQNGRFNFYKVNDKGDTVKLNKDLK